MSSRILLIGQAPGPNTHPDYPLHPMPSTSAGARLASIMGIEPIEYLKIFDRVNVLRDFPGKAKKEDKFPLVLARNSARAMEPFLHERRVVLIGRNVAMAFGLSKSEPFHQWRMAGGSRYRYELALVPHTSGLSRWYNNPENVELARRFWQNTINPSIIREAA